MEAPVLLSARRDPSPSFRSSTVGLRRALLQRGEHLAAGWPGEAAEDLRAGRLEGVVLQSHGEGAALGILSTREPPGLRAGPCRERHRAGGGGRGHIKALHGALPPGHRAARRGPDGAFDRRGGGARCRSKGAPGSR